MWFTTRRVASAERMEALRRSLGAAIEELRVLTPTLHPLDALTASLVPNGELLRRAAKATARYLDSTSRAG